MAQHPHRPPRGRPREGFRTQTPNGQGYPGLRQRTLWNDLLANDLVDELHSMIGPVVLGVGTAVFDGPPAVPLRLVGTRTLYGSGNVLARYEVRQESPTV